MKTIRTKEELKEGLKNNEKEFKVVDKKLIRALAVQFWIQKNPIKGTALLAALPVAAGAMAVSAPVAAIVGTGLTIGSVTITVAEIVTIGLLIIALTAVLKGQKIKEININTGDGTGGTVKFD